MDISTYGKHGYSILLYLLNNGEVPVTDFNKIGISPHTYYRSLSLLQSDGLVKRREVIKRRKIVLFSLTEKGISMAKNLKQAQDAAEGKQPTEPDNEKQENSNPEPTGGVIHLGDEDINIKLEPEERKNSKYLKLLIHSNVLDDHITVEEAIPGRPTRIFNIYIKQNGHGYFRLWCEADNSFDCWHVKEAWTYPAVQKMMMEYKYKTKVCPYCKTVNDLDADYCKHCGAKLE